MVVSEWAVGRRQKAESRKQKAEDGHLKIGLRCCFVFCVLLSAYRLLPTAFCLVPTPSRLLLSYACDTI